MAVDIQVPQTSYALRPQPAYAGQFSDSGGNDIITTIAQVPFDAGLGICQGTTTAPTPGGDRVVGSILPTQASDVTNLFLGVSIYIAQREPYPTTANRFQVGDAAPLLDRGRIWVHVDPTLANPALLTDSGPVYLVYSGANAGTFRHDNANANAAQVTRARCRTGGAAGGVAEIHVNLP